MKKTNKNINTYTKKELITIHQLNKIAMTFWVGGSLMTGLVIFPLLFKSLDEITASNLTGQILSINAYIGIVCLLIALIEVIVNNKFLFYKTKHFWYIFTMSSIIIVNYFAIFPIIAKIRQHLSLVAHKIINIQKNVFDFWHSISSMLFIITCILGLLYLIEI